MYQSVTRPRQQTMRQARPADDSDLQDQVKNPGSLLRLHNLLRVATYNTRTCRHEGEADLLALDLQQAGVMVCGLQEMRRRGSGHTRLQDSGYHLVWSGDVRVHHRGVGALIHPMAAKALKGWAAVEGAEDRLLILHFEGSVHATIIVAYAPTELAETPVKDAFYAALDSTLEALPSHRLTLVLGDLNARVGTARDSWHGVIGGFGCPRRPPPHPHPLHPGQGRSRRRRDVLQRGFPLGGMTHPWIRVVAFAGTRGDRWYPFAYCVKHCNPMYGLSYSNDSLFIHYNNRRLVTLAEHTSDHGRQTNSSTEEKGEQV